MFMVDLRNSTAAATTRNIWMTTGAHNPRRYYIVSSIIVGRLHLIYNLLFPCAKCAFSRGLIWFCHDCRFNLNCCMVGLSYITHTATAMSSKKSQVDVIHCGGDTQCDAIRDKRPLSALCPPNTLVPWRHKHTRPRSAATASLSEVQQKLGHKEKREEYSRKMKRSVNRFSEVSGMQLWGESYCVY